MTATNMRISGYYWLKMSWGKWIISHWEDGRWDWPHTEYGHTESCILEIDENRITRKELKPCVVEPPDADQIEIDKYYDDLKTRHPEWWTELTAATYFFILMVSQFQY